ncbi:SRPBCC domain-containing protein [Pseudoroseicyclus sp. CXY001]|uniref:SRPBCC family protein n=1 Tax=Pseudoroseicyclus sp. CXY001 TaxID=3242492 RepID=UPI003570B842
MFTSPSDHPENTLRLESMIHAPPEAIFSYYLRPELISAWLGAGHGIQAQNAKTDVRIGGRWQVELSNVPTAPLITGIYHEILPFSRLVLSYGLPDNPASMITVTLRQMSGVTRLTLLQTGFPGRTTRDQHAITWALSLRILQEVMEISRGVGEMWNQPDDSPLTEVRSDIIKVRERLEAELIAVAAPPSGLGTHAANGFPTPEF